MIHLKTNTIPVIILAGGQSQRLRLGDKFKWQLPLKNDATVLDFIISKSKKFSNQVLINAPSKKNDKGRRIASELENYKLPIVYDASSSFKGPLSGLLSCLKWAKDNNQAWVATIACDTPFFPDDFLTLLADKVNQNSKHGNKSSLAISISNNGKLQPIFGLWSSQLYDVLNNYIQQTQNLAIGKWVRENADIVELKLEKEINRVDAFFNINTIEDYKLATAALTK